MATVEAEISDVLLARLAALTFSPALPVAWPGLPFTPPSGAYLVAAVVMNGNRNQFVGDDSTTEFRGILQVTVEAPSGGGIISSFEIAGKVAQHFERGTPMRGSSLTVKVDKRPDVASARVEADRIRVPISVSWYAFR